MISHEYLKAYTTYNNSYLPQRKNVPKKTVQKYVIRTLWPIQFLRKSYGFRTFIFNSHPWLTEHKRGSGGGGNIAFNDFRPRSIRSIYYNTDFKHIQKLNVLFGLNNHNKH